MYPEINTVPLPDAYTVKFFPIAVFAKKLFE